ncbi:MAG: amidohydrolase family protein [Rhodobacteraceae bacterium]|nr:amidohydrolase family protein [Paracoccaceae bacterium]
MASDLLLKGGLVLDIDRGGAFRGDILVSGGRIAEVSGGSIATGEAVAVRDCSGFLVIPGLINAHTHGHGSLGKGLGDLWTLELLLNASSWAGGGFSDEDRETAATLNATEMVLKGCTAAYDLFTQIPEPNVESLDAVVRGYLEVGVRVVLAPMMADRTFYESVPGLLQAIPASLTSQVSAQQPVSPGRQLATLEAWLKGWSWPLERARPALAPTIPTHCTKAFLEGCRNLARDYDIGIQMHLAESKPQAVAAAGAFGKSLTAYLHDLDLLGPRFTGAHCVWVDDDDILRLADTGARVAHNPGSNLRLGCGIAPVRRMLDAGITVGIGSDGSVSSDNQNMFEAKRLASYVSRAISPDPQQWVSASDVMQMAGVNSAAVLGFGREIGRIAPGCHADLVLLDLANVNFVPLNDAVRQLVQCEDSSAVDTVMIGGEIVLEARRFTMLDYDRLRRRASDAAQRLLERTTRERALAEALEPIVAPHCIGLARKPFPIHRYCGC